MKRFALASLVAASLLAAMPAGAQSVLPGANGTICDFVAANAGHKLEALNKVPERSGTYEPSHAFADLLVKAAAVDIDKDGDLEILSINPAMGTMHGDVPVVYGSAQFANYQFLSRDDDIRWSHGARWLPFRSDWYLVYFEDEALEQAIAVAAVTGAAGLACRLKAGYEETDRTTALTPAVTAAFNALRAAPQTRPWDFDGGPLTAADRAYLTGLAGKKDDPLKDYGDSIRAWSVSIDPKSSLRSADLDGDGVRERMAAVGISSGAGRGCDARFLELLPAEGKAAPDPALRDLVRSMQGVVWGGFLPGPCATFNDMIEIEGRGYLYINRVGNSDRDRRLTYVKNGKDLIAAISVFKPTHTVVFDREKPSRQ